MSPAAILSVAGIVAFIGGVILAARASRRLLVLRIVGGRIASARGRAPGDLLHDVEDITERAGSEGTIALVIDNGQVVVHAEGNMDPAVIQRLRNVVGRFTLPRLRGAPRVKSR